MSQIAQYRGTGKRKTSVARVILRPGDGDDVGQRPHDRGVLPARRLADDRRLAAQDRRPRGPVRPPRPRPRRRPHRPGRRGAPRDRPGARRGEPGAAGPAQARGLPHARRPPGRAQEGRAAQGPQGPAVLQALASFPGRHSDTRAQTARRRAAEPVADEGDHIAPARPARVPRRGQAVLRHRRGPRHRGRVPHASTSSSSSARRRRSGRAAAASSSAATRAARARSSRRRSRAASSRPAARRCSPASCRRPRSRCSRLDLGVVISASHNPPEYNGVKFFDRTGRKLTDTAEEEIEALLDAPAPRRRRDRPRRHRGGQLPRARARALRHGPHRPAHRGRLRERRVCRLAPRAFEQLGAEVEAIGDEPNGSNINVGCGATDLAALQELVASGGFDLGVAFDGDGDRMLAVDEHGETRRRRPDRRDPRAASRRRPRRGDDDDEPRLPPADGGARRARRHDRRRRPLRARGAVPRGRHPRRRAVGPHHLPARPRHRRRARGGAAALRGAARPHALGRCRA